MQAKKGGKFGLNFFERKPNTHAALLRTPKSRPPDKPYLPLLLFIICSHVSNKKRESDHLQKGGSEYKKPRLEEEETKRLYTLGNKENLQTTNIVGLAALDVQQAKLNVLPRFYEEVEVTALQEDDAHSQLKELGARLDQLAEENNSLKERVVALEKDNATLNERNTRLNERVVDLEKDNATLNERNTRLNERVVDLEKDNATLNERNTRLNERVVALEKDNATLNERNTRLNERVVALEKDNATLNERVANLERHRQEIINTATQSTPTRGH